jgi:hypothetical protein
MEYWWIYLITFIFGYVTCKTFYFFRTSRISLSILSAGYVIYLSSLIKALEHLSYAREIMREHMLRTEKDSIQISSFEQSFDKDVELLKVRSINTLLSCHPEFFKGMVQFEDWSGAMKYLQENKEGALSFWGEYER